MRTEVIAGLPIHVRTMGQGARPVLALHCSLAHGGAWGPMAAQLGDAVTLTAPDLPGHGHSADWPADGWLHDSATAVAAALAERIGGGQPVDVLGHSFGGTVALRLAVERPDLVRSLSLFEPVMFSAALADRAPETRDWQAEGDALWARLERGEREAVARRFQELWGGVTPLDSLPQAQRSYIVDRIHVIPAINDVTERDRAGLMTPGRIEAVRVPVLLAEGALSPPIIPAINRALLARLPHARHLRLDGATHMLPLTHPEALAPAILETLGL